jgi:hypothetical protein
MKVTLKVERGDGSYLIEKWDVSDDAGNMFGPMMVKYQMQAGHALQRLIGQVSALPPKREADEL